MALILSIVFVMIPTGSSSMLPGKTATNPATTVQSSQGHYTVQFSTTPHPIPLNQAFILEVSITAKAGTLPQNLSLSVDARMPQHRHGMVRQPELISLGEGRYQVREMLFHMPGRWELYFDLSVDGMTERARAVVTLE